jgi:hypothetical protein
MSYPRTGYPPYPPTYEREYKGPGTANNPDFTNPFPPPANVPAPGWTSGPPQNLSFFAGPSPVLGAEAITTCTWRSPLFDLRPERRGSDPQQGAVYGQPVWRGGSGANLYIQIFGLLTIGAGLTDLVVNLTETVAIASAANATPVQAPQDISDQVVGLNQSGALMVITPPGSGYPPRYWSVSLTFDKLSATAVPALLLQAAYY